MPLFRSHEPDAPTSPLDQALYSTREPGWMSGIRGEERPVTPGADTGVLAMVVLLLVLIGLNMRHVRRLLRTITQDLWSVRRRANAFDDHTAKESRTILILLLQLCCFEGILLYLWLGAPEATVSSGVFAPVGALAGLAALFYVFCLTGCVTVGYVFTDRVAAAQWSRSSIRQLREQCCGWPLRSMFCPELPILQKVLEFFTIIFPLCFTLFCTFAVWKSFRCLPFISPQWKFVNISDFSRSVSTKIIRDLALKVWNIQKYKQSESK